MRVGSYSCNSALVVTWFNLTASETVNGSNMKRTITFKDARKTHAACYVEVEDKAPRHETTCIACTEPTLKKRNAF